MGYKKTRTNINIFAYTGGSTSNMSGDAGVKKDRKKDAYKRKSDSAKKAKEQAAKDAAKKKSVPTFEQFLDQVGKGKFKGGAEAHKAYQAEFGSQIPGAGMGAGGKEGAAGSGSGGGGKAGVPGSSSGKHSNMSNAMKEQEAKNKKKP